MLLAIALFVITLALVMLRPRPFNEASAACLGAFLMVVTGVVSLPDTLAVLKENANVLLFFLGLMLVSTVAESAGFFSWCAFNTVKLSNGSGRKLLVILFILGADITAFFSNDATALIMTPIVFVLVTKLKLEPLPYVFACAFIANTASMLLPVSNPVNLLAVGKFGITLGEYLGHLLIPSLLLIILNIALFALIFRKDIKGFSDQEVKDTSFRGSGGVPRQKSPPKLGDLGGSKLLLKALSSRTASVSLSR